jgi:hypothetical protein
MQIKIPEGLIFMFTFTLDLGGQDAWSTTAK